MLDIRRHINNVTPAQINDLEGITRILNQAIEWGHANAFADPFMVEERISWFKEHSQGTNSIYVYKDSGLVLGYITVGPYRKGRAAFRKTSEVSYYVDFKHHRKGIATQLMHRAIAHCQEKGIHTLLAFLYGHNAGSIAFLEKFGFNQWGMFPATAEYQEKMFDHVVYGKKIEL